MFKKILTLLFFTFILFLSLSLPIFPYQLFFDSRDFINYSDDNVRKRKKVNYTILSPFNLLNGLKKIRNFVITLIIKYRNQHFLICCLILYTLSGNFERSNKMILWFVNNFRKCTQLFIFHFERNALFEVSTNEHLKHILAPDLFYRNYIIVTNIAVLQPTNICGFFRTSQKTTVTKIK